MHLPHDDSVFMGRTAWWQHAANLKLQKIGKKRPKGKIFKE